MSVCLYPPLLCEHGNQPAVSRCFYCEIEKRIKSFEDYAYSKIHNLEIDIKKLDELKKRIDSLGPRILKIESQLDANASPHFDHDDYRELKAIINKFEDRIKSLENCWHYGNPHTETRPHKCPVCDGKRTVAFNLSDGTYYRDSCKSCDGKGIVWG